MGLLEKRKSEHYWCEVMRVDPETAKAVLEGNTLNRDIGPLLVKRMAADMMTGKWLTNGDSIKFDRRGKLVDGQHRLTAVVESGQTLETFVCGGLDPAIFATLDVGKKRTLKDAMKISGVKNYELIAPATVWLVRLKSSDPVHARSHGMKPAELLAFYREHEERLQWAGRQYARTKYTMDPDTGRANESLVKNKARRSYIMAPPGLIVALAVMFGEIDEKRAEQFIEYWGQASIHPALSGTSPLAKLAEMLAEREAHMARVGGRVHDADRMLMAVHTWNAFIRGEKISTRALDACNVRHPSKPSKWPGILGPKSAELDFGTEGDADDEI